MSRKILLDASEYSHKNYFKNFAFYPKKVRNFELYHFETKLGILQDKFSLFKELKSGIFNVYLNKFYNNIFYKKYDKMLHFNPQKSKVLFAPHLYFKSIDEMVENTQQIRYILKERFWNYTDLYPYKDEILQDLSLKNFVLDKENEAIFGHIKSFDNSVAVHIRRGDFLFAKYPVNLSLSRYYENAFKAMKARFKDAKFFIFSDDKVFIKTHFADKKECEIISLNDDSRVIYDFYLMQNCKHFIMANSTLSWWVAFSKKDKEAVIFTPMACKTRKCWRKLRTKRIHKD
ncbi:alpha-1,2-fucosyltransferase [Campylobacter troglodytis]|uniref:alpha-1,2-fucosyltransferase n=1 Tax=Campylobacter troglodytis TaxID=654363 RepID=UPI00115A5159|nr:alpha-1,2-fucosyltransferase [Campylobacter troglodytis]TQR60737.1 hypothetical protein DMC01_04315 [Campylobacter troglodytis]